MDFSGLSEGAPNVLDSRAKFDESSNEYRGTRAVIAEIDSELSARLQNAALIAARAVRVRDYGRVDIRLSPTGDIYVLEVNANCYLEQKGEFAMAAAAADMNYRDLIQRIVDLAVARHSAQNGQKKLATRDLVHG
jgi:D-alanine-D-alanine ligase